MYGMVWYDAWYGMVRSDIGLVHHLSYITSIASSQYLHRPQYSTQIFFAIKISPR